ncbi:MAG: hypothetical protein J0M21_01660 [Xanthomonadales bacterium]|nr:hypothetical protein [Xanthomonadales bacterium]
MPKYKAEIFPSAGGASHRAYVESDDQWSAEALLKLQYPGCEVRWVEEVREKPEPSKAKATASDDGTSSSREFLGIVLAVAIGAPVIHWVNQTFFDEAPPAQVAAEVDAAASQQRDVPVPAVPDTAASAVPAVMPDAALPAADTPAVPAAPAPEVTASAAPQLQSFDVVVQTPDGGEATLAVSARDEAHALQIVRDFRGNPPVVRVVQP